MSFIHLINQLRPSGDEAVTPDLFPADDAFQEKRMLLAAKHFERTDRRKPIGQQLPINRNDRRGLGNRRKLSRFGKYRRMIAFMVSLKWSKSQK